MRIYFGVYFENLKCAMSIHSYTSLGGASFIGELWVFGAAAVVVRFQFRVSAVDWTLERPPHQHRRVRHCLSLASSSSRLRGAPPGGAGARGCMALPVRNGVFFSSSLI